MSALIRAMLSHQELQIEPGQRGEFSITVQNLGETVDQYSVEVVGLSTSWFTVPVPAVSLFPQDQEKVRVTLHPPSGPEAKAGSHPFTVRIASRQIPTETTEVPGTLVILTAVALKAELSPQRMASRRRGVYRLTLTNPGNSDLAVRLSAADPEEACTYRFQTQRVDVVAGESQDVSLHVLPKTRSLRGEARNYEFTVRATPASAPTRPKVVVGFLEHRSLFPRWALPAALAAILLLCCGAAAAVGWTQFGDDIRGVLAGTSGSTSMLWEVVHATQTIEAAALQEALAATQTSQVETFSVTQTVVSESIAATQTALAVEVAQAAEVTATQIKTVSTTEAATTPSSVPTIPPESTDVPTHTPEPSPTPSDTSTPASTDTPTVTPTPCPLSPDGFFYPAWIEVRARLGCPVNTGDIIWSAEELFERGHMIWREDTRGIFAVYDDGSWEAFTDLWSDGDPEYSCPGIAPLESPPTPKRGFGKIWCVNTSVRDKLGWAQEEEKGGNRQVQDFKRGAMIGTGFAGVVVLHEDGTWQSY